jgi:hypothetical protein
MGLISWVLQRFTGQHHVGGGIDNEPDGTLTISNCTFSTNSPDNIFGSYIDAGGNTFI